jgi:hypothetical protein
LLGKRHAFSPNDEQRCARSSVETEKITGGMTKD